MQTVRVLTVLLLLFTACRSQEERLGEHVERAQAYFDAEQWNEAKIEYLNVLQIDPENADAHYKLAQVQWNLAAFGEARWNYKEAVRLDPENIVARLQVARIELAVQRAREAQEQVDAILALEPDNVDALLVGGAIAAQGGDSEGLLGATARALEIDPANESALVLQARALEELRRTDEAQVAYESLVEAHPTTQNYTWLALFLSSQEQDEAAQEAFRAGVGAAKTPQEKTNARLVLANSMLRAGKIEQAEAELLAALDEAPENSELLLALARYYAFRGDPKRAEEMLELRVNSTPGEVEPLLALADFHRTQGDSTKNLETVERVLAIDPESEVALLRKAELLMERQIQDPELGKQARGILAGVMERNPDSVRGLFTQGKFLLLDGRAEEAAAKLRRVVDEEPNAGAYVLLGNAYLGMGEPDLARSELLRAVQLEPSNVPARTQLAGLYAQTGEKELAVQEAEAALQLRPNDVRLTVLLAGTLHGLDRDDQAAEILNQVDIERNLSTHPKLRMEMAQLYRRVGELDRARELLMEEGEHNANDPLLPAQLALVELAERNPQGAIAVLDQGIEQFPDEAYLYELRARVRLGYLKQGKPLYPDEAEADLKEAIAKGKGTRSDPYMLLAGLYQQTNRSDFAIQTYEQAMAEGQKDPSLMLVLAMLYEQSGEQDKAIDTYRDVVNADPKQGIALNNLAWLLVATRGDDPKELDRAHQYAQRAKEILPDSPSVADTLGWVMLKKGIPSAAISLFREAIDGFEDQGPSRALIRFHLALAYKESGDADRAIEELEIALAEAPSFPERSRAEALLRELKPT